MKFTNPTAVPKHCLLEVCQNCQSHKNKPSRCTLNDDLQNAGYYGIRPAAYVGRKTPACSQFLNKHTGMGVQGGVIVCKPGTTLDIETGEFSN